MASILKVDTLTGVTTAGSVAVTGEGNSTTTNLQQGLTKMWAKYDAGSTLNDSFNVSTLTDSGSGLFDLAFTNSMGNANFAGLAEGNNSTFFAMPSSETTGENTTSKFRDTRRNTSHTAFDSAINRCSVHGDLA
tara:strand:+ start:117 stop:518 length:402 start_codon:yes stop_codon:yes gene_type:complete